MGQTKRVIRSAGHTWTPWDGDGWSTTIGRFQVVTWPFGDIHQSKVFVRYRHARPSRQEGVGMCLPACKTSEAAMRQGVRWVASYKKNGPPPPEQVFRNCFKYYPELFRTRADVLDTLFFGIGGGYDWLDGAIVCTEVENERSRKRTQERTLRLRRELDRERREAAKAILRILSKASPRTRRVIGSIVRGYNRHEERCSSPKRPMPDSGTPRKFYPVSPGFSNICLVPRDVRSEWFTLAYEAALLLRDRSGVEDGASILESRRERRVQASNRKLGTRIVRELERRFPRLKRKAKGG